MTTKKEAVLDHYAKHPEAMPSDVVAALTEQGIQITPGHVSNIKTVAAQAAKRIPKQRGRKPKKPKPDSHNQPLDFKGKFKDITPAFLKTLIRIGQDHPELTNSTKAIVDALSDVVGVRRFLTYLHDLSEN